MKITDVKTAEVRIKDDGKPTYLYHYVRIHTDEGVYGTGEASHVDGGWRGSTRTMADQIIGKDPRDVDAIFEGIRRSYIFRGGMSGLGISALTGIEIALWDLAGKAQGVPVYRLPGGKFREHIQAASGAHRGMLTPAAARIGSPTSLPFTLRSRGTGSVTPLGFPSAKACPS